MGVMSASTSLPQVTADRLALAVCVAAMLSLAVAMGVGRFAFTPVFPLMVRDGLIDPKTGATLAASNYLGYFIGAISSGRVRLSASRLLALGLISTVATTAALGLASSEYTWVCLRFAAGVFSAWTLVATTSWGLGWLAVLNRPRLAGVLFSGVGLGITGAGLICQLFTDKASSSVHTWIALAWAAAAAAVFPLAISIRFALPATGTSGHAGKGTHDTPDKNGLVVSYAMFGFGYILPATYLPVLARQIVDDPRVFGFAWPLFGAAAAASTIIGSVLLNKLDRLRAWAASHALMALGVVCPVVWRSMWSIGLAALLVGGTFMVITMVAMQEARMRAQQAATPVLAQMTAGFAVGQLAGPVVSALLGRYTLTFADALDQAELLSALGLLSSALYLLRLAGRRYVR